MGGSPLPGNGRRPVSHVMGPAPTRWSRTCPLPSQLSPSPPPHLATFRRQMPRPRRLPAARPQGRGRQGVPPPPPLSALYHCHPFAAGTTAVATPGVSGVACVPRRPCQRLCRFVWPCGHACVHARAFASALVCGWVPAFLLWLRKVLSPGCACPTVAALSRPCHRYHRLRG